MFIDHVLNHSGDVYDQLPSWSLMNQLTDHMSNSLIDRVTDQSADYVTNQTIDRMFDQ